MNQQSENQSTQRVSDTVSAIRAEAQRNEIFGAICYNFAHRQRTKETLTVRGLKARMEKEGADFRREDYVKAMEFLASLGLGTLKRDNKGRVTALTNMRVTLQSIGQASALQVKDLKNFKRQRRFSKLPEMVMRKAAEYVSDKNAQVSPILAKAKYTVSLIVKMNGNPITIPGPIELAPDELGEFLIEFSEMTKSKRSNH